MRFDRCAGARSVAPERSLARRLHSGAMDLHVIAPLPSPAERAAVDAVIGPPAASWTGGRAPRARRPAARRARRPRGASQRHLLLPALEAVQARVGYISEPALAYICRRLTVPPAEAYGVATFYALLSRSEAAPASWPPLRRRRLPAGRRRGRAPRWSARSGPAARARDGTIATGPAARASGAASRRRRRSSPPPAPVPVEAGLAGIDAAGALGALEANAAPPLPPLAAVHPPARRAGPAADRAGRPRRPDATSMPTARTAASPACAARIEIGPAAVVDEVLAAKLVGRGGAAFPTGRKWAGGRGPARAAALPRLQRRRVGARHVQGPAS